MKIKRTKIEDVMIIEPDVHGDPRGWFSETYSKRKMEEQGIYVDFLQDNHSFSEQKGTLRGLHFQKRPKAQTKLVRCIRGRMLDVAVDLRKGSHTYKEWVAVELSQNNKKQILIPKGFAHGFVTLTDNVEVEYKVDEYFSPEHDSGIRYDDPEIGVQWGVGNPILSEKDKKAPLFKDSEVGFSLKFLVTGARGQLGSDIVKRLKTLGLDAVAADFEEFDITNRKQTEDYILEAKPDMIIHCAAYTDVDKAEDEKDICSAINITGTKNLVLAAKKVNAKFVYISTDYVFDGKGDIPQPEDKATNPVNFYGQTKAEGEKIVKEAVEKHYIIRTSWIYGSNGKNFVKAMIDLAKKKCEIDVVCDQIGAPTYTVDLAEFITDLIQTDNYGTYHGVSEGYCSWYEFASYIFDITGNKIDIKPISTNKYPTKAKRPLNSRLAKKNTDQAGINRLPHWKNSLTRFLSEYEKAEE